MNDKELLELAAKAAGIDVPKSNPWFLYSDWHGLQWLSEDGSSIEKSFNPLNDDGDALRLAVKLDLSVCNSPRVAASWVCDYMGNNVSEVSHDDTVNFDPSAATRRAIVRAAAEIGKEKR